MSEEMQDLIAESLNSDENSDLIEGVSTSANGFELYLVSGKILRFEVVETLQHSDEGE